MNREVWFRVLQVAVVAPWLYQISSKTDQPYFRIGLKLVAGSIIMLNVKPLYQDYLAAQKLLTELRANMAPPAGSARAIEGDVIEGEASEIP